MKRVYFRKDESLIRTLQTQNINQHVLHRYVRGVETFL